MKLKKLAVAVALLCSMTAMADGINLGFTDSGLTGWTLSPSTGAQTATSWNSSGKGANIVSAMTNYTPGSGLTWNITPYSGNYMAALQPTGSTTYNTMATNFGLSAADKSAINNFLVAHAAGGQTTPTNAAYMYYTGLNLTAGTKFTVAWNFVATDYTPWNDTSLTSLVPTSGGSTPKINGYVQDYSVLGAINTGAGNWSVGSYGSSGWQVASYEVLTDGVYTLGLGDFNLGDTALSPILLVSGQQGITLKNGQSFGPIVSNDPAIQAAVEAVVTPTPTPPVPTGPVAVNNALGATATNPAGTTTLEVTNAGTYTNNGTNGSVTNTGTFTNNATTGVVTNTSGTFTNTSTGTTGNVNNAGTFNNSGTVGTVTNTGTFTNDGTTSTVTNTGGFTNSTGATTGTFTNSNAAVNSGTTGDVINSGTFGNNSTGTTGAVTNNGTFLNSGAVTTVTNNADSVFTNNATGTTGAVTNGGTFTNGGMAGAVNNLNVFNNTGTTGSVTNSGAFTNAGATGDVVNSGTFTNTGTLTSINNQGGFNTSGAGSTVNLTNYTQSPGASTLINGGQKIVVSGTANLNGDLTVINAPTAYGNYTYLTAGTLNGTYSSLTLAPDLHPLGYGLVYTGNDVKLKVTPSPTFTQSGVTNNANSLSSVNNMIMGTMNGALGYDCSVVGEKNMCFSTGVYGIGSDGTKLGGVYAVLGRQVTDNIRAGVVVDKGINKISVGNVSATNNTPSLGGYVNWNMYPDGQGLALRASGSVTSNNVTVNRDSTPYSESAQGKTSANGYAYQLKASYTMLPTSKRLNITPYVGVRRSSLAINGFTETGAQYPLSYNSLTQSTTDALAGASVSYDFDDKLAGFVSAGMIKNLSYSAGALSGTSDIIGMSTFNSQLPAQGYTSPTVGAGLSYDLDKNQVVTVSTGWQQKTLTNTSQITGAVNYTVGF